MFVCCADPNGAGPLAQAVSETVDGVDLQPIDPYTPSCIEPTPAQLEAAKKEKAQEINYAPRASQKKEPEPEPEKPKPEDPPATPEPEKPPETPLVAAPKQWPSEGVAKLKFVDANGLALMCFGFSTWMFFAFLCNADNVGGANTTDNHAGVWYLGDMLTWGVGMGLVVSGIVQGLNGDHLGCTSYIFHAAILGTIGWNFKCLLGFRVGGCKGAPGTLHMISFFCYAAFWFNIVFTIMAFRIAKMFGILYASVAIMWLFVGLNWQQTMSDELAPDYDRTGDYITGMACLVVALQCFYLSLPVMTGIGIIV